MIPHSPCFETGPESLATERQEHTWQRSLLFTESPNPCGTHVPAAAPHAHEGAHTLCHLLILREPDLDPATSHQVWITNHGGDRVMYFSPVSSSFPPCACLGKCILHCSLSAAPRLDVRDRVRPCAALLLLPTCHCRSVAAARPRKSLPCALIPLRELSGSLCFSDLPEAQGSRMSSCGLHSQGQQVCS